MTLDERIEAAAKAGWAVTQELHNVTTDEVRFKLGSWDEEPGVHEDWRAFMRAALPVAFPEYFADKSA